MIKKHLSGYVILILLFSSNHAMSASDKDINTLRSEIQNMKQLYEGKIAELESKLDKVKENQDKSIAITNSTGKRKALGKTFNPSIGLILNGKYNQFSSGSSEIAGFAVGHEGERSREGFTVDHTEFNFSASIDDKFFGSITSAIAEHEGKTETELEEAFIQTLPGFGLPNGMSIKAGRAFWTLGYLNEHHSHTDDFADRPLPYRIFLNEGYNDDGVQISYVLPTDLYVEVGAGGFRGDDFPFGSAAETGIGAWSAFGRVGGDISNNQSWRLGASIVSGEADGSRTSNEDLLTYTGDTDLYVADVRYTYAPTGNGREKELILQGEYFSREEDGIYADSEASTGNVIFDNSSSGWYGQAVYKFNPRWRLGARYSQMNPANVPSGLVGSMLDANGHDPKAYSVMVDWTNSDFSRVRFQYNQEELTEGIDDSQFTIQYVMSFGAHAAHKY